MLFRSKPLLTFYKQVEDSRDTVFNRWLGETLGSPEPDHRPRRTFVVTAVNDGRPILTCPHEWHQVSS